MERQITGRDLEAGIITNHGNTGDQGAHCSLDKTSQELTLFCKLLSYPVQGTVEIYSTSWLDGVRGVAAFEVYLYHTMFIWTDHLRPAFHSSPDQNHLLQFPMIRTFLASGCTAVSLFFVISGYVLTQRSIRSIRERAPKQVYPAVASSIFRRGFRLYLPVIIVTFCEMITIRFGLCPSFNGLLDFVCIQEANLAAQFMDWLKETTLLFNPFHMYNFSGGVIKYPKYEGVVWTIPIEYYGSLLCFILLFLLAPVAANYLRMGFVAIIAVICMLVGSWHFSCFLAGMFIADYNLGQEGSNTQTTKYSLLWTLLFLVAFYVAGLPYFTYAGAPSMSMPGYETLRWLTPSFLYMDDQARFMWSLSGMSLLFSISQLPRLKTLFDTNFCQYLGKISFSLYLIHHFCIALFGLRMQEALLHLAGVQNHAETLPYWLVCGVWYALFTLLVFALAGQVTRWVDRLSVRFARWLEEKVLAALSLSRR
ncbi:Acyltransferase 3 [Hyaloscypha variabilis]|uniref:Acyltransferase 3 domain-containing protein n=1 Tax=Hyaloscypha variabilis (strain UAMH 11265 / GT02V1 / F) TaxID=1149755 RepID=A0A2J6S1S7_HYAVF|nr:hypothetical protein L207DRAFT_420947 [Hyaloscypha variabilis F]